MSWDRDKSIDKAQASWGRATDELFDIDRRVKANQIAERDILFALSGVVSNLVVAVGALILAGQEVDTP